MKYNKIDVGSVWKAFEEAFRDTEKARLDFFLAGLIIIGIQFSTGWIPFFGNILHGFIQPLIVFGCFQLSQDWRNKKESRLSSLFIAIQDKTVFEKLKKLCLILAVMGLFVSLSSTSILAGGSAFFLSFILKLLIQSIISAVSFIGPILVVEKNCSAEDAIKTSIRLSLDCFGAYLVGSLLFVIFFLGSIATLGVGFYYLLPILVYFPYLIYQKLFEENVKIIT